MAVMEVIDDAHVLVPLCLQRRDDGQQVLGLAEPIAMVVEADLAALRSGDLANRLEARDLRGDTGLLVRRILDRDRAAIAHHPQLRMHVVLTEQRQRLLGLVVQGRRKPPTRQRDPALLQGDQLSVPLRDVFGAVIIDELLEAQRSEHRGARLGATLLRVEGHDAPGRQILLGEQRLLGRRRRGHGEGQTQEAG